LISIDLNKSEFISRFITSIFSKIILGSVEQDIDFDESSMIQPKWNSASSDQFKHT